MNKKNFLGVIPARAGSKGIPKKNIKPLNGIPLIQHSIRSALKSKSLNRICVSTNDIDIIKLLNDFNDVTTIIRPEEFATDNSPTEETLIHALEFFRDNFGEEFDYVVTLEPTSPFRSSDLIDESIIKVLDCDCDSLLSISEDYSSFGSIESGYFKLLNPKQARRRQDRLPMYKESSTIYITSVDTLLEGREVLGSKVTYIIVDEPQSIDINTELDFLKAEAIMGLT